VLYSKSSNSVETLNATVLLFLSFATVLSSTLALLLSVESTGSYSGMLAQRWNPLFDLAGKNLTAYFYFLIGTICLSSPNNPRPLWKIIVSTLALIIFSFAIIIPDFVEVSADQVGFKKYLYFERDQRITIVNRPIAAEQMNPDPNHPALVGGKIVYSWFSFTNYRVSELFHRIIHYLAALIGVVLCGIIMVDYLVVVGYNRALNYSAVLTTIVTGGVGFVAGLINRVIPVPDDDETMLTFGKKILSLMELYALFSFSAGLLMSALSVSEDYEGLVG
jgi:hypothetical protein